MLSTRNQLKYTDTDRLRVKGWRKDIPWLQ